MLGEGRDFYNEAMNTKQNTAYSYLMLFSSLAMILGFVGYLVSWTDGIFWPELSITVIVLGAITFVFSAVPVAHQETFDKVLAVLPEERQATFRDA